MQLQIFASLNSWQRKEISLQTNEHDHRTSAISVTFVTTHKRENGKLFLNVPSPSLAYCLNLQSPVFAAIIK